MNSSCPRVVRCVCNFIPYIGVRSGEGDGVNAKDRVSVSTRRWSVFCCHGLAARGFQQEKTQDERHISDSLNR